VPNGGMTREEFAKLEKFFEPLAGCIEGFAARHNLRLDRYYHESPSWSLRFSHPLGGSAAIDVLRVAAGALEVRSHWWVDVHREYTRYLRDGTIRACVASAAALAPELDRALVEALSWRQGEWTRTARGYEKEWGRYSEDEFARLAPDFPRPIP
jgi:hypothetical protein